MTSEEESPAIAELANMDLFRHRIQKIREVGCTIFFVIDVTVLYLPLIELLVALCDFILGRDPLEVIIGAHDLFLSFTFPITCYLAKSRIKLFEGLFLFLVVLMVLQAEAVDAIERFWGEDALVWDSKGMEEVLQLI